MKPINILGLKNFRVFDDQNGIFEEMSSINILTGANNSGKSSIIKALQMVKNSVKGNFPFELDLTEQEHLLGDFENVVYSKQNKEIVISLPFTFLGLTNLYISLTFIYFSDDTYKAKLRKIEVIDNSANSTLFMFSYREATTDEKKQDNQDYNNELKELEQKREDSKGKKNYALQSNLGFFSAFENPLSGYVEWTINSGRLRNYLINLLEVYKKYIENKRNSRWLEEVDNLYDDKKFPLLISTFIKSFKNDIDVEKWQNFIENVIIVEEIAGKSKIGERDFEPDDYFFPIPQIEEILYFKSLEILRTKLIWKNNDDQDSSYDVLENCFRSSWEGLSNRILSINYLSTVREQNSRIYNASLNSPFINLLKDYYPLQYNRESFLNKYLKSFDIGENLIVEYKLDYQLIFASVTTFNDGKRELVDFGYGIKQLILILIQITVLAHKNVRSKHDYGSDGEEQMYDIYDPSALLVEEPETNLHPKWQSLLAEMFLEASQKYNIQLIIETHSEYLIRRFQTLVAEKKVKGELIKIFYLRDRIHLGGGKKQIEKVKIEDDGTIDFNVFDGGFFDESEKLELSLLNIRRDNFITEFNKIKEKNLANEIIISELEEKIDQFSTSTDIEFYKDIVKGQIDISKLSETTVKYLTSGQFLLINIPDGSDFSPIVIQYARALESEMKKLFINVSSKNWMFGNMQGALEKFKFGRTTIDNSFTATQLNKLIIELTNFFYEPQNLKIELINVLREIRNSAGHAGAIKTIEEARSYIENVNDFLVEWITQKKP